MKAKRFLLTLIIVVLPFALTALSFVIPTYLAYQSFLPDELTLQEKYQEKKGNYEHLVSIAQGCIKEGSGINILEGLNTQNIKYEIYDDGKTIIFCYYIIVDDSSYYTELLLSDDYKILDEKGSKLEDYETFKDTVSR